jgi:hypothetical protein
VYDTGLKLPRIVGHAHALDPLMSARRAQSDEALRIGLVNRLYPQPREQTLRARFSRRRGEAATTVYWEMSAVGICVFYGPSSPLWATRRHASRSAYVAAPRVGERASNRCADGEWRLQPVFALRAMPGTLHLRLRGCATRSRRRSVVEPGGIEPPTSSLRTTRSPS